MKCKINIDVWMLQIELVMKNLWEIWSYSPSYSLVFLSQHDQMENTQNKNIYFNHET